MSPLFSRLSSGALALLSLAAACSLDGLADGALGGGGVGGSGGAGPSTSTVTAGGMGGEPSGGGGAVSAFVWLHSFGTPEPQSTSPYSGDPGYGSSLKVSAPGPDGDVWIVAATRGVLDPDGSGGFDPGGTESTSLFFLQLDASGAVLDFRVYEGTFSDSVKDPLAIGEVLRIDGGLVVVGSIKGGALDLGGAGIVVQESSSSEDGFVVRLGSDGVAETARQLGGNNPQTARAAAAFGGKLYVTGKLRRTLTVTDPVTAAADPACEFPTIVEDLDRVIVASFDEATLECEALTNLPGTDPNTARQGFGIAADELGVYVVGGFTRQLLVDPLPVLVASGSEDAFVVALSSDLVTRRWAVRATGNQSGAPDRLRAALADGDRIWIGGYFDRGSGSGKPIPAIGPFDGDDTNDCTVPVPEGFDGVIASLDRTTGNCLAANILTGAEADEVRSLSLLPNGVIASGFTTQGIAGLAEPPEGGARDGFVAFFDADAQPLAASPGFIFGGDSWDYIDGALVLGPEGLLIAGSYDNKFDVLDGDADFFVGLLPPSR